jgi:phage shock protein A
MGVLDRLSQLIQANVNDLVDRAEDPGKMLDQLLRDMQENMGTARQHVATMIAQEKELEADVAETRQLGGEWGAKAQRAVAAGKDDLAREALRRKRDSEENSRVYEQQLAVQQQAVDKLKTQLRQLESKYQATVSQRDALVARQRRARAQQQVATSLTSFSPLDPTSELDRMERRIRGVESQAAAAIEVGDEGYDAQFRELDEGADVEEELAALKAGTSAAPRLPEGPATALGSGSPAAETTPAPDQPGSPS